MFCCDRCIIIKGVGGLQEDPHVDLILHKRQMETIEVIDSPGWDSHNNSVLSSNNNRKCCLFQMVLTLFKIKTNRLVF